VLLELRLRNVAVIESVTLPLTAGLNVLTGETGAGKSLIVGALGLLLGERAAPDRIRAGADRAVVEATFDAGTRTDLREWLDTRGVESEDDVLILKREVSATGRSRAWVNGSPVTIAVLRELGAQLVAVHGQHEAQQLLDAAAQRALLDAYAGATGEAERVAQSHARVLQAKAALSELHGKRANAAQRADYLRFLVQEIDGANLRDGDDERVETEHRRLANAEELRALAAGASQRLQDSEDSVTEHLGAVRRQLAALQRIDPSLERLSSIFDSAFFAAEELARELVEYADGIDADPARLRELDARRAVIHQLVRKYGPSLHDVLLAANTAREELALVDDADTAHNALQAELARAIEERAEAAASLSVKRTAGSAQLASAVTALLPELGMTSGTFAVRLASLPEPGANGSESVLFVASLNAGLPAGPLDRVASGGELARVMLALSTVLARLQRVPTLVFDEVDAGVGGAVAWQVGALMRGVAAHHQVLAISHLAQIAACAHHHVVVRKDTNTSGTAGLTTADTQVVVDEERVLELARMLSGDADREISRAHARELLTRGQSVVSVSESRGKSATRGGRARAKG
jgi:DNA repair protein RecN (Recombination protein N)